MGADKQRSVSWSRWCSFSANQPPARQTPRVTPTVPGSTRSSRSASRPVPVPVPARGRGCSHVCAGACGTLCLAPPGSSCHFQVSFPKRWAAPYGSSVCPTEISWDRQADLLQNGSLRSTGEGQGEMTAQGEMSLVGRAGRNTFRKCRKLEFLPKGS